MCVCVCVFECLRVWACVCMRVCVRKTSAPSISAATCTTHTHTHTHTQRKHTFTQTLTNTNTHTQQSSKRIRLWEMRGQQTHSDSYGVFQFFFFKRALFLLGSFTKEIRKSTQLVGQCVQTHTTLPMIYIYEHVHTYIYIHTHTHTHTTLPRIRCAEIAYLIDPTHLWFLLNKYPAQVGLLWQK